MTKKRNFQLDHCGGTGYFSVFSRAVGGPDTFTDDDRDEFRQLLRANEEFGGVRIVAWTVVSNYFRMLVEIPEQDPLDEAGVKDRCRAIYAKPAMDKLDEEFALAHQKGKRAVKEVVAKYERRMGNLTEFVKTLKQKFTKYYNRTHKRAGVFWESRFDSVLVESSWDTISKVAAYVDLAPVREGMVEDPKDYGWCGYAEAVAGKKNSRVGYVNAFQLEEGGATWKSTNDAYRKIMFGDGDIEKAKKEWTSNALTKALQNPPQMTLQQLLRLHVRYFDSGLVIGQKAFAEEFFENSRDAFYDGRETGARRMVGRRWGGLHTVRQLFQPLSVPEN